MTILPGTYKTFYDLLDHAWRSLMRLMTKQANRPRPSIGPSPSTRRMIQHVSPESEQRKGAEAGAGWRAMMRVLGGGQ